MDLEIKLCNVPLPKEAIFSSAIWHLMRNNGSLSLFKREIFVKIRTRMKEILPLIVSDFKAETNVTIKDGEISGEDSRKIDLFLGNVEKMNLLKFLNITLEEAFQKESIVKECKGLIICLISEC